MLLFSSSIGDVNVQIPKIVVPSALLGGGPLAVAGFANVTAVVDPGASNDVGQGYSVGSIWVNNAAGALRVWDCIDNTLGAAKWAYSGANFASGGTNPNSDVTQFGLGAALAAAEGNINRQISSAGVAPGATGADNVLAVYSLPAGSFDVSGRGINVSAMGQFAANGNTKRVKVIVNPATAVVGSTVGGGGTTICDTGAVTTSGGGWSLDAYLFKYGAAGSNTQMGLHQQAQVGGAVAALLAPSLLTAVESGPILVAVTGNATTTATDILFNFLAINAMN